MHFIQSVVINVLWLVVGTANCLEIPCRLSEDPQCILTISFEPKENILSFSIDVAQFSDRWLAIGFNRQTSMVIKLKITIFFS